MRTTLWASTCWPSSQARVTSVNSFSSLRSLKAEVRFSWKSFHCRHSFSSDLWTIFDFSVWLTKQIFQQRLQSMTEMPPIFLIWQIEKNTIFRSSPFQVSKILAPNLNNEKSTLFSTHSRKNNNTQVICYFQLGSGNFRGKSSDKSTVEAQSKYHKRRKALGIYFWGTSIKVNIWWNKDYISQNRNMAKLSSSVWKVVQSARRGKSSVSSNECPFPFRVLECFYWILNEVRTFQYWVLSPPHHHHHII